MRVLILGGTGVLSRAIVDRLLLDKHEVAIFNRGSKDLPFKGKVRQLVGDRMDREAFEDAMAKERFDAVIDMICFNEADARSTVRAFRGRVEQLVICSSIAVYKRPYRSVPTVEAAESLHDDPEFAYAFHKAEVERYLWRVIDAEKLPITFIRPSLTYGPGVINMGVLRQNYGIVHRIRQGKPLVMFGDGSTSWSFTFAPDLAKGFAGVLGNPATYGQAYHVTSEERNIWEDLYLTFGKIVGKAPRIVHIPSALLHKAAPNLCGHLHWEKAYTGLFDNTKIKRDVPGFKADITLEQGLETIVAWYEQEAHTVDPEKDALEDALVSLYQRWEGEIADLYTK